MNRYTFVIQVHADGPSTLENLSTREVVPVSDLASVGPQIERWLTALPAPSTRTGSIPGADALAPAASKPSIPTGSGRRAATA